jgi:hypothetical protein
VSNAINWLRVGSGSPVKGKLYASDHSMLRNAARQREPATVNSTVHCLLLALLRALILDMNDTDKDGKMKKPKEEIRYWFRK